MKLKRYYIENDLIVNQKILIDGEEYHHMKNVMRSRVGEHVILFNGTKFDAIGEIVTLDKNSGTIKILEVNENKSESNINVTLFQAVCKGDKLSLITQKITELGVSNLLVFYSQFTDIKDKTSKVDKLNRVSISASKQCGRSSILNISGVMSFDQMIEEAKKLDKVYVAYENAENNDLLSSLLKNANLKNVGLIIGAEGGFSEEEIKKLTDNNIEIVTLGKRILRTETASIVGASTIMFALER